MSHLLSGSWNEREPSLGELRLCGERVAEALERAEQGVDLEEGVLAQLRRRERELERDRVDAVGDPQLEPWIAPAAAPAADVDAHVRVAVQARAVQARALVQAGAARAARDRAGTPRVLQQV